MNVERPTTPIIGVVGRSMFDVHLFQFLPGKNNSVLMGSGDLFAAKGTELEILMQSSAAITAP